MKTSKMLGAVALTAALAMGTVPAFAATASTPSADLTYDAASTSVGEDKRIMNVSVDGDKASGAGDTTVFATSYVPQLNVTVPIEMGVAFPATKGDILFPSDGVYQIKNNSTTAGVKIENVKVQDKQTTILLTSATDTEAATGTSATVTSVYNMNARALNMASEGLDLSTAKVANGVNAPESWTIAQATDATTPSALGFHFEGKANYASGKDGSMLTDTILDIAQISYTVSTTI